MVVDLFANIVPCKTVPGLKTRFDDTNIDLVVIRENTQGGIFCSRYIYNGRVQWF